MSSSDETPKDVPAKSSTGEGEVDGVKGESPVSPVSDNSTPASLTKSKTADSGSSDAAAKDEGGEGGEGSKNQGESSKKASTNTDGATESAKAPEADIETVPDEVRTGETKDTKVKRKRKNAINVDTCKIGFYGAGKMTECIIRGLIEKKIEPKRLFVTSKAGKNHDLFKSLNVSVTKRGYDIFAKWDCDLIFFCVHGLIIKECFKMGGTRPMALTVNFIPLRSTMIYILSLVGGVPISDIKTVLLNPENPEKYKCEAHRIMLNCSVSRAIGLGAIDAEIDSKKVSPIIRDILTKIAKIEYYPETQMDILCAVGGNGLAFIYYFVAAMADGGFKMGLPKKMAVSLATKTLHASALCMLESGKHPSELRDSCTAPSGPAIYGITNLEKRDCASGIAQAVETAGKRIKELVDTPCL